MLSAASVRAPASGPNKSTDVNVNISDGEKCASTEGTFSVKRPLRSVSAAKTRNWTGTWPHTSVKAQYAHNGIPSAATTEM